MDSDVTRILQLHFRHATVTKFENAPAGTKKSRTVMKKKTQRARAHCDTQTSTRAWNREEILGVPCELQGWSAFSDFFPKVPLGFCREVRSRSAGQDKNTRNAVLGASSDSDPELCGGRQLCDAIQGQMNNLEECDSSDFQSARIILEHRGS